MPLQPTCLLAYIARECPTVVAHKTMKEDFDADVSWPPTEAQVNKSALNICLKMLEHS